MNDWSEDFLSIPISITYVINKLEKQQLVELLKKVGLNAPRLDA
ncbi:hypothetical protein [Saccharibacillus endophyticus]|nr:hypothetical protein [Saccharibacillus endophyticus]